MRIILILLLLSSNLFANEELTFLETADMVMLDKMSATRDKITLEVGKKFQYGDLLINLEGCWAYDSHYQKSFKALVSVVENGEKGASKTWLFSEHPITGIKNYNYEMILQNCDTPDPGGKALKE